MKILDKGYIEVEKSGGTEQDIVKIARISYKSNSSEKGDLILLRHLIDNNHGVPFEHVVFTFKVKCPIFVMRQIVRYRHASISEVSGRYTEVLSEFYIPEDDRCNKKSDKIDKICNNLCLEYHKLLASGVEKEIARIILPLNTYTEFYWTINLRSLLHFLEQRLSTHAQLETQEYAKGFAYFVKLYFPNVWEYFKNKNCF